MNVNLDVLELIFEQLTGSDLVSSAQVSRAFLAGVIPSLYASIEYTTRHAKRSNEEISPFATLVAHDHLGVHVKRIVIHSAPIFQSATNVVSPIFLDDLARALRTTTNLRSFHCAIKILALFIPHLVDKPRLHNLRICASLASRQMSLLKDRIGLYSLALDFPSWCVIDALPVWTSSMQKTLAHLTLFMSQDLDANILNATLTQLPRLRGLHVIGCPRITHSTVLRALSHTPDIRELSFTVFPSQETVLPHLNFCLPPVTHLSIDVRASYPGLKSLIARIISRLSPRDALAICGGWIGEIKGSEERTDPPPDAGENPPGGPAAPGGGGGLNFWQGHVHVGPMPGHAHDGHGDDDPPLLTPPVPHHGNALPNQAPPPPNIANPGLPHTVFGFSFPLGNLNLNGNNNNNNDPPGGGPPNPLNQDNNPDQTTPSLVSSLPSTLSTVHLPQISPAGLREVVDRCQDIRLLGIVIGNSFSSPTFANPGKTTGFSARLKRHSTNTAIRPEVNTLSNILSRARVLRELIVDASPTEIVGNAPGAAGPHGASSSGYALLTPTSVRMLMTDSPLLRRIVAEGRIWESRTPTPSTPVPFPRCLDIELRLKKARYAPGANYHHAHGPPGFGNHGGGYAQLELGIDHWFWLTGSASGGKGYSGF